MPIDYGSSLMLAQAMTQQATRHACRVYVGGLPPLANEQTIATFFSQVMAAIGGNSVGSRSQGFYLRAMCFPVSELASDGVMKKLYEGVMKELHTLKEREPKVVIKYATSNLGEMFGMLRLKKVNQIAPQLQQRFSQTQVSPISTHLNHLHLTTHHRRDSFIGLQEHYKWDHGGSADVCTRKIRAEANCPRCSFNRMDLLFSDRRLPNLSHSPPPPDDSTTKANATSTSATSASGNSDYKIRQYQALNLCPNCTTTYYFRPHQIAPLQGTVVEIGRLTNTTSSTSSTFSSSNRSATKTNNSDNNNKSHSS
ncbi:hypothetical protein C1H46_022574 [Malus baccata]|uniref:Uncharacterized protein n=1 Tax=Malus baccata TaxID=106549 RepID=A0A540LZE7_MALBA|nr:hypothetical protein C1H46_022574 [Malus baccata]